MVVTSKIKPEIAVWREKIQQKSNAIYIPGAMFEQVVGIQTKVYLYFIDYNWAFDMNAA